jgi:hypothetical protein
MQLLAFPEIPSHRRHPGKEDPAAKNFLDREMSFLLL